MNEPFERILKAIDYIETHLVEDLRVTDMAAAAGYSLYHFIRLFNQLVFHTPFDYLMRRRLSESTLPLLQGDQKITDLALDYGFHNPEVYTRAFKRIFGIQPSKCRQRGWLDQRFILRRRTAAHLELFSHQDFGPPSRLNHPGIQLAGISTRIRHEPADRQYLWQDFKAMLRFQKIDLAAVEYYGVSFFHPNSSKYYMAAVALATGERPYPLLRQDLPAGSYAAFSHPGSLDSLELTREYIYQTWSPKSGGPLSIPMELEYYGPDIPFGRKTPTSIMIKIPLANKVSTPTTIKVDTANPIQAEG